MSRLLFEKRGSAVWISHLDLMRLFQRAFKRAGLHLTHTQGYNPRPSVSIALPLSVGVQSVCELLDFELDGDHLSNTEIAQRLNNALVEGVRVLQVYDGGAKIKDLAYLSCLVQLEYDSGVPDGAGDAILNLFSRSELTVQKKGKNGVQEQDIIPMIRSLEVRQNDAHTLIICATVCCQNPSLNPALLVAAVQRYLPEFAPDFSTCSRMEVFDKNMKIFR